MKFAEKDKMWYDPYFTLEHLQANFDEIYRRIYIHDHNQNNNIKDIDVGFGSMNEFFYKKDMEACTRILRIIWRRHVIEPEDFREFIHEYLHEKNKELEKELES